MALQIKTTEPASPAKLRSGDWGARVPYPVSPGDTITITAKSGKSWQATVDRVVWQGDGVWLVSTVSRDTGPSPRRTAGSPRGSGRRGNWTGCSCGSREIDDHTLPSPSNCQSCQFDALDQ